MCSIDTIQHFRKIVNTKKRERFSVLSIFCQIVKPFDERFAVEHEVIKEIIGVFKVVIFPAVGVLIHPNFIALVVNAIIYAVIAESRFIVCRYFLSVVVYIEIFR